MLFTDFVPEGPASGIVEFAEDVVGQDDRRSRGQQGIALEAGEAEGQDEEALLTFGGVVAGILAGEEHSEIVPLWAAKGRARSEVGDACLCPGLRELFGGDVRLVYKVGALIRESRPGACLTQGRGQFG